MNDNPLAMIPMVAYEQPIFEAKSMFGNRLLVSDPVGIKRVLLDKVANYPKTALHVRILSSAFGDGLLTSDGDKWRRDRASPICRLAEVCACVSARSLP